MRLKFTITLSLLAVLAVVCGGCTFEVVKSGDVKNPLTCPAVEHLAQSRFGLVNGERAVHDAIALGAFWSQPFPGPFVWGAVQSGRHDPMDFTDADALVAEAQRFGISQTGVIWPYADWDQPGGRSRGECRGGGYASDLPPYRCAPTDDDAYGAFLAGVIERYDGDSLYDLEELCTPIRHWEVAALPALQTSVGGIGAFRGDPVEYFNLLRVTYRSIKASCPQCDVHYGALKGNDSASLSFLEDVLRLGGADYFDAVSLHTSTATALQDTTNLRELLETFHHPKPVWITSMTFDPMVSDPGALTILVTRLFLNDVVRIFLADVRPEADTVPRKDRLDFWDSEGQSTELLKQWRYIADAVDRFSRIEEIGPGIIRFRRAGATPTIVAWREEDTETLPASIRGTLQVHMLDGTMSEMDARDVRLGTVPIFLTSAP